VGGIADQGFTDSVEAFTVGVGWSSVKSMPQARAWLGAAALADGRVLAIGGSVDTGPSQPPPLDTVMSYDPTLDAWNE
jgi:hypothetical protein